MAADLTDELLKTIANSAHRCYGHEGRAMAAELIRRREAEKKALSQQGQGGSAVGGLAGLPHPFHP